MVTPEVASMVLEPIAKNTLLDIARKRLVSAVDVAKDLPVNVEAAEQALRMLADLHLAVPGEFDASTYRVTADGSELAEQLQRQESVGLSEGLISKVRALLAL